MSFRKKLPEYHKSVAAGTTGLIILINEVANLVPGTWAVGILVALNTFAVWLAKNKKIVDAVAEAD